MSDSGLDTTVASSWDTYWRGSRDGMAYSSHGTDHPTLQAFWHEVLNQMPPTEGGWRIVDIASGNGAVEACVYQALGTGFPGLHCLDISAAAVGALVARYPMARGIVADARAIPLRSHDFHLVTSQFGLEYAGSQAFPEAARLPAPGGRLALLLHSQEGSIYQDCGADLHAVDILQRTHFIPLALQMFDAGFDALAGADRKPYDAAAARLWPAIQALEQVMERWGQHVAGDLVLRLYNDVSRIRRDLRAYDRAPVLAWLRRLGEELPAYEGRMDSMRKAALDRGAFEKLKEDFARGGYRAVRAGPLAPSGRPPLAWALIAERS